MFNAFSLVFMKRNSKDDSIIGTSFNIVGGKFCYRVFFCRLIHIEQSKIRKSVTTGGGCILCMQTDVHTGIPTFQPHIKDFPHQIHSRIPSYGQVRFDVYRHENNTHPCGIWSNIDKKNSNLFVHCLQLTSLAVPIGMFIKWRLRGGGVLVDGMLGG